MKKLNEERRLPYSLVGIDGNAFSVMGYVRRAMKENGYSAAAIQTYSEEAMSGDYDNLLSLSVAAIDKINRANGYDEFTQFEKEDGEFVDYNRGIYNDREQIIDEAYESDPKTLRRCLYKGISKGLIEYVETQEMGCEVEDVVSMLNDITIEDIENICSRYDIDLHGHELHRKAMDEAEIPEFSEDDELELDTREEILRSKSLMPMEKNQRCLYLESEDLESLGVSLEKMIDFLERNINIGLEGILWEDNLQVIISDEYKFNELMKKMKDELHISIVDITPFVYRYDEMKPIIDSSYKKRYFRN